MRFRLLNFRAITIGLLNYALAWIHKICEHHALDATNREQPDVLCDFAYRI